MYYLTERGQVLLARRRMIHIYHNLIVPYAAINLDMVRRLSQKIELLGKEGPAQALTRTRPARGGSMIGRRLYWAL